jgi:hypothetical protein
MKTLKKQERECCSRTEQSEGSRLVVLQIVKERQLHEQGQNMPSLFELEKAQ